MRGRSHRSHAAAHASVGMTWLLNSAAAIDARHRASPRRHDMAAGVTLKQFLTEPIRIIRKVWARFGSFRLEKEKTKGMTWLLESSAS